MLDHLIANAIFIFYKHSSLMLIIRKYMKFCTHTNYLKQVNRMLNLNSALMIRKYIDLKNTKKWLALNLILLYIFYRKICIFVLWCKMYFNTFPLIVSRWCCIAFFCNKSALTNGSRLVFVTPVLDFTNILQADLLYENILSSF